MSGIDDREPRCPAGHKVCAHCHGCRCEDSRVMTDSTGRILCVSCREVDNNNHGVKP